jgi:hypothetical protein
MEQVDTVLWLEAQAFWIHDRSGVRTRDEFYR